MSTHAVIAKQAGDAWEGRFLHNDGEPRFAGKRLWELYHHDFAGKLAPMLKLLFDKHQSGWSSIHGNSKLAPGWWDYDRLPDKPSQADWEAQPFKCFCHYYPNKNSKRPKAGGIRDAGPYLIKDSDEPDCEWAYIFSPEGYLTVAKRVWGKGWLYLQTCALAGEEPDWQAIERKGNSL